MNRLVLGPLALACLLSSPLPATAQPASAPRAPAAASAADAPASAPYIDAVVRKVDPGARKVTLQHHAITNLDMPGMTMAFPVADPALLADVKPGDAVRFTAEKVRGAVTVTRLRKAP